MQRETEAQGQGMPCPRQRSPFESIQQGIPKPMGHQAEDSALNKGPSCLRGLWSGGAVDTQTDKDRPVP